MGVFLIRKLPETVSLIMLLGYFKRVLLMANWRESTGVLLNERSTIFSEGFSMKVAIGVVKKDWASLKKGIKTMSNKIYNLFTRINFVGTII